MTGPPDPTEFSRVTVRAKNTPYSAYVHRGHSLRHPAGRPDDAHRATVGDVR